MKKQIIVLAFILALGTMAFSQNQPQDLSTQGTQVQSKISPDEKARKEAERAEKQLQLTTEQKLKWENAVRERVQTNQRIHATLQGPTTPDERRKLHEEQKESQQKFDESVNLFLSAEQKVKYETFKAERKENRKERMEKRGGKQPLH